MVNSISHDRLKDLLQYELQRDLETIDINTARDTAEASANHLAQMRSRVHDLKSRREAERSALAEEKMAEKWRLGCDELRQAESHAVAKHVAKEREAQLIEKQAKAITAAKEDSEFALVWEQSRLEKVKREEYELEARHMRDDEQMRVLNDQIQHLRQKAQEELALKQQQAVLMRAQIETQKLQDEQQVREKAAEQRKLSEALDRFNRKKLAKRAKEARKELAFELDMLKKVAEIEHAAQVQKQETASRYRDQMNKYLEYLESLKGIEAEREREQDQIIAEDVDRVWREREAQWEQENRKRKKLLNEVLQARQDQMQFKRQQNLAQQEQAKKERLEIEEYLMQGRMKEIQKHNAQAMAQQNYRHGLEQQVQQVKELRRMEEAKIQREIEAIKREQDKYMERVSEILKNVGPRTNFPLQKSDI